MKNLLLIIILLSITKLNAQDISYEERITSIDGYSNNATARSGDIDGDGDIDLFVLEGYTWGEFHLYINNGTGSFSLSSQVFDSINFVYDVELEDLDDDGDLDLLLSTRDESYVDILYYYVNDGNGNFSLSINPFGNFVGKNFNIVDLDNDNDLDVFFPERNDARFFFNDGLGNFTDSIFTLLPTDYRGEAVFEDIDMDNDLDMIICGNVSFDTLMNTFLFTNDGMGNFTELPTNIINVGSGSAYFGEFTGDNYPDLFIYGQDHIVVNGPAPPSVSKFYSNDGNGNFVEDTNPFSDIVQFPSVPVFTDIDNDNDLDLLAQGYIPGITPVNHFYENNNDGSFNRYSGLISNQQAWYRMIVDNFDMDVDNEFIAYATGYGSVTPPSRMFDVVNANNILRVEVFSYPVSSLDTCDGDGIATVTGGLPPYVFDWFTQTYNENVGELDSLCQGFHTLKVFDSLGDSALVDYYVTDSINWYNVYNDNDSYVDTIYIVDENCVVDFNLLIDSVNISDLVFLYSGVYANQDYYLFEMSYFQAGNQFIVQDTILLDITGQYLLNFSFYCPTKSISQIKTIIISLDYPTILGVKSTYKSEIINIYPNPAVNTVAIDLGKTNSNSNVFIIDFSGKIVYDDFNVNKQNIIVDLKNYSSGLYFVTIINSKGKNVMKLIKQ